MCPVTCFVPCVQFWQLLWRCTRHLLGSPGSQGMGIPCTLLLMSIYTIPFLMWEIYCAYLSRGILELDMMISVSGHNLSDGLADVQTCYLNLPCSSKSQWCLAVTSAVSTRCWGFVFYWTRNWKSGPTWWCRLSRLYWATVSTSYPSFSLEQLKCEISDFTLFSKTSFGTQLTFDEQTLFYLGNLIGRVRFLLF